jgi:hypothetical protein
MSVKPAAELVGTDVRPQAVSGRVFGNIGQHGPCLVIDLIDHIVAQAVEIVQGLAGQFRNIKGGRGHDHQQDEAGNQSRELSFEAEPHILSAYCEGSSG